MPLIPGVPAFKREPDSGNLAFLAAQAALSAIGPPRSVAYLAGASGDAFKFVYDNAPVREPLRDLRPADTLARAFAACGLRAEWVPDATLDHVRGQVEAQAGIGRPVLTSSLPGQEPVCVLLVGYDADSDTLAYRAAAERPGADTPYASLPLGGAQWDGPLTGPPHWADFPLLVIRGPLYDPPDEEARRRTALQAALDALTGAPIPYPAHPGAARHADLPLAGRSARQGLAALELLAADIAAGDLGDAATLWRLDAQLRQLAWDRALAALYLESWEGRAPAALIARYRTVAHTARTLLSRLWERRSATMYSLHELRTFIASSAACLYALPDDPRMQTDLALDGPGLMVILPRGAALLVDRAERRAGAARLAGRLLDLEQGSIPLLQQILSAL